MQLRTRILAACPRYAPPPLPLERLSLSVPAPPPAFVAVQNYAALPGFRAPSVLEVKIDDRFGEARHELEDPDWMYVVRLRGRAEDSSTLTGEVGWVPRSVLQPVLQGSLTARLQESVSLERDERVENLDAAMGSGGFSTLRLPPIPEHWEPSGIDEEMEKSVPFLVGTWQECCTALKRVEGVWEDDNANGRPPQVYVIKVFEEHGYARVNILTETSSGQRIHGKKTIRIWWMDGEFFVIYWNDNFKIDANTSDTWLRWLPDSAAKKAWTWKRRLAV